MMNMESGWKTMQHAKRAIIVADELLTKMEKAHPWFIETLSPKARRWWEEQKRRVDLVEKRAKALAKLTPAERTLLGFRSD